MKTNIGLVEHAKKAFAEGWGYVYGTIGQVLTESVLKQKQVQYPNNINQYLDFIKSNWLGKRTVDCVGLIKSYLWWNGGNIKYDAKTDISANGAYEKATEKGDIKTIPEIPGLCVRFPGHIGIYIGNGEVIESRGTKYGVVKTKLKDRPWTHWLKYPGIEYITGGDIMTVSDVWKDKAVDFVMKFQKAFGLVVDGKAGDNTNAKLDEIVKKLKEAQTVNDEAKKIKEAWNNFINAVK